MRRNLQRFLVAMAAMMVCIGASAIDKVIKKAELINEITSEEALAGATFMLQNGEGEEAVMLYTPSGWDIKVAPLSTALNNLENGGKYKLEVLGENYLMPVYNLNGNVRTYWAGNQYVNSQPAGGNVIFGLSGTNEQHGQDGPNLAVWDIAYQEGKGFIFHCTGRDIYIGHDGTAARPVAEITYWRAFTDYVAGYDKAEVEAAYEDVTKDLYTSDDVAALATAKSAYDESGDLDAFAVAVNKAIDVANTNIGITNDYGYLMTSGNEAIQKVAEAYEKGEYATTAAFRAACIAAAKTENKANSVMTGVIVNPSFELVSIEGWTSTDGGNFATNKNFGARTGDIFVEKWTPSANKLSDGTFLQEITELPNGTYKLTAEMQCLEQGNGDANGTGLFLVANDQQTECKEAGETVEVTAEVTDGTLTIGAKLEGCSGNWICFDNFQLTLVEPEAPAVPVDDWYTATNITEKYKGEDGKDANKPAEWVVDGENGFAEIKTSAGAANTWDTQAFFQIPEELRAVGSKVEISFYGWADADYNASCGGHKSNDGAGWTPQSAPKFQFVKDKWTLFSGTFTIDQADLQYVSMDLSTAGAEAGNTFRFDDVKFAPAKEDWAYDAPAVAKDFANGNNGAFIPAPWVVDEETGNGYYEVTSNDNPTNPWDCQIFISVPGKIAQYDKIKVSMMVKADTEFSASSGMHKSNDGNGWIGHAAIGNVKFTNEWALADGEFEVSDASINTLVLDLSDTTNKLANKFYFDDIKFEIIPAKPMQFVDVIPEGDGNGEAPSDQVYLLAKERPVDGSNVHRARYTEAAAKDGQYGVEVVTDAKTSDAWDNQFWIRSPYALPSGAKYTIEFDYKAEKAGKASTQAHSSTPGSYIHYIGIGDVNFTEEWQHYKYEGSASADQSKADNPYYSVAFNMNEFADANTYYFDNITWKIDDETLAAEEPVYLNPEDYPAMDYVDPSTLEWSDNLIPNGDIESEDMSAFYVKEASATDAKPQTLMAAQNAKAGNESANGIQVKAIAREADPENEGSYLGADWDTQFFVRLPYMLPAGTRIELAFDMFSSREATPINVQAHMEPGEYKGNMFDVTIKEAKTWEHYQNYLTVGSDMRTLAFNLSKKVEGATYRFDNFSVKVLADQAEELANSEAAKEQDANSTFPALLALNEKLQEAKTFDASEKSDEFKEQLAAAIEAGETERDNADKTNETIAAATQAIEDALNYVEPEPLDPDLVEIPQDQAPDCGDGAERATVEEGDGYTQYTTTANVSVIFKMLDVDVAGCDYILIKFAEPIPAGIKASFAPKSSTDNFELEEGISEFKLPLDDARADVNDDILSQITLLTLWNGGKVVKVAGVYKHKSDIATDITETESGKSVKNGVYMENGKIVIVKDGKKFTTGGVEIK